MKRKRSTPRSTLKKDDSYFNDSLENIRSIKMNRSEEKNKFGKRIVYWILLIIGEIFGIISVVLVGFFYPKDGRYGNYDWETNPFSYHPLFMTIGLLFCYGNGIILYRTFPKTKKILMKSFHGFVLISSLAFAAAGLAAIIRSKNQGQRPHFFTYHSWIGITTLTLFVFQWILGFISFLFPQLSLSFRQVYLPRFVLFLLEIWKSFVFFSSHRFWGKTIFVCSVIAILTGLSEHGIGTSFFTPNDEQQSRRYIMNFFAGFTSLFSLIILYLLSNPDYQRPTEPYQDTTQHNIRSISVVYWVE